MKPAKKRQNMKVPLAILGISIIIISTLLVVVNSYRDNKQSLKSTGTMEIIVTPKPTRIDLDELNKNSEPGRLYLAKNYTSTINNLPAVDVYLNLPLDSKVYYYSEEANALDAEVTIDGSTYLFSAEAGGRDIDADFNTVKDELLQFDNVSLGGYRVFMKDMNIVAIILDEIKTKDFYLNNIEIRKKSPTASLSLEEKKMWEEVLNSIQSVITR